MLFWRWLNHDQIRTISSITDVPAYDWIMDGDTNPQKQFEIVAENRQVPIINYDAITDSQ